MPFVSKLVKMNLISLASKAILDKPGRLTDDEMDEMCRHTTYGYEMVKGRIPATAAQIVLNHHQRFDGQGFPVPQAPSKLRPAKPMEGTNIHIFSRVVAVANAVDVLIGAGKKRGHPLIAALAKIQQQTFGGMFDPVVLDAALRVIPPFPLGACVDLSDSRRAVVTDLNELQPCQPTVQCPHSGPGAGPGAGDENQQELDLASPGAPTIVRIGEQDVDSRAFYTLPHHPPLGARSSDSVATLS